MKKFLVAVAALACMGSVALAGPNDGGTIFVHDANLVYTVDTASYCGLGGAPVRCEDADTVLTGTWVNGSPNSMVWKVYAAFPDGSSPRLKGMTWGVQYTANVRIVAFGACIGDLNNGAAEFQGPGWPGNNTGDSIVWQNTQTTQLVEAYWFAGYDYYALGGCFNLRTNPDPGLGGMFGSDDNPPILDPITGFGSLGFDQTCGADKMCPGGPPPPQGACCVGTVCSVGTESDCLSHGGIYQGDGTDCDPDPCALTGACCVGTACTVETQALCEGHGGVYQGDGTDCDPNPCEVTGACCLPDHTCIEVTRENCANQNGEYQGDNIPCDQVDCGPVVPTHDSTWGQIKANYR